MIDWTVHHLSETRSTNLDARAGVHADVFTADFQTDGRGRLDHRWQSVRGENLMMSAVLSVAGLDPERVATLPLAVGLSVVRAVRSLAPDLEPALKWPNDVLVGGRKLSGVLCERRGDCVIAGIGVNVRQVEFPQEIAARATSLSALGADVRVLDVRDAVLASLGAVYESWRSGGFAAVYPQVSAADCLKGRLVSVLQTDADTAPLTGICRGISPDGSLDVAGRSVFAGEAHVRTTGA